MKTKIRIKKLVDKLSEVEKLFQIAEESFEDGSPWTLHQFKTLLIQPYISVHVAETDEKIIGILISSTTESEAEIFMIGVAKTFQNQSIGTVLLEEFKSDLIKQSIPIIYLEVRRSNKVAQNFYINNGFKVEGTRKKYYSNPTEDALVLKYQE